VVKNVFKIIRIAAEITSHFTITVNFNFNMMLKLELIKDK
jgi:hypothetical protein